MKENKKKVAVLGSTGSIGTQALEVCENLGYEVTALSANRQVDLLEQQARKFQVKKVAVMDKAGYQTLKIRLADTGIQVLHGMEGLCEIATQPEDDLLLNSVMGMVGLTPTISAIQGGKTVALANKETLVAGGKLVMQLAGENQVQILPVDSEHSAIFQCLQGHNYYKLLHKILLTASGGPFFGKKREELEKVTPQDALKHPNWEMGAKITIDSATMMNKGLELIEAVWLFGVTPEQVEIIVHPESIVHSLVEFADHSVLGQLGVADMRIPIQYALTYPERLPSLVPSLSLAECGCLHFMQPDNENFPAMNLCREAIERGGLYPAIVNGANERAVELFLKGKISFLQITELVERAFSEGKSRDDFTLADVLEADQAARELVERYAGKF